VTTNHKKDKVPITKEKLVYEVAKCVEAYFIELKVRGHENPNVPHTYLPFRMMGPPSISVSAICT
jgi:hypothetical protein